MVARYKAGDIVKMRKTHPCGGEHWEVMRTGVDIRIKCTTCGRVIMLPRPKFEKSVKEVTERSETSAGEAGDST